MPTTSEPISVLVDFQPTSEPYSLLADFDRTSEPYSVLADIQPTPYSLLADFDRTSEPYSVLADIQPTPYSMLVDFQHKYARIHGYVSSLVCIVGVICNVFIVIVLTRKQMVNSTNQILTFLAVSDLLTMSTYIPFAIHFYCEHGPDPNPDRNSLAWMRFFIFHANLSVTAHTTSIWLGVLLAIYRYVYVRASRDGSALAAGCERLSVARTAVLSVSIFSIFAMIPNYMSMEIVRMRGDQFERLNDVTSDVTFYSPTSSNYSGTETPLFDRSTNATNVTNDYDVIEPYYDIIGIEMADPERGNAVKLTNFWMHAIVVKLLPCVLMSAFGLLIVCVVRSTHNRAAQLRRNSTRLDALALRRREHNRTTSMLVAVIILFLVTELPQGILALLSGIHEGFYETYYNPLGDAMDIVALINNGINFALYCAMSAKFRHAFLELFCCCIVRDKTKGIKQGLLLQMRIIHPENIYTK